METNRDHGDTQALYWSGVGWFPCGLKSIEALTWGALKYAKGTTLSHRRASRVSCPTIARAGAAWVIRPQAIGRPTCCSTAVLSVQS
jgi:hypothetical protein